MKSTRFIFLPTVILTVLVLAACGLNKSDKTSGAEVHDLHAAQNSLHWSGPYTGLLPYAHCEGIEAELTLNEDKKWQLVELNGKPVDGAPETHHIIFHSKEQQLEAKANCNVLPYTYKITKELTLKVETEIPTLMVCPDDLEQRFKQMLERVGNLSSDGGALSLNRAKMAPSARFELVK